MGKDEREIMEVVERINDELAERFGENCPLYLIFGTTGYAWDISVEEHQVFCSEKNSRRYDEKTDTEEPWETCIRRVLKERAAMWAKAFGVTADDLKEG